VTLKPSGVGGLMSLPRPAPSDVLAGLSVATILVPQAMAYAELAGLPARVGLFAAAVAPLAAVLFASSRYLHTGPIALTSLMTIGILSAFADPFTPEYLALAALLALIVGVVRAIVGLTGAGTVAYLMSQPVVIGFTVGAAVLIIGTQIPQAFGVVAEGETVLARAGWTVANPAAWDVTAVVLGVSSGALMLVGRRIHRLFPGVLTAVVLATIYSVATDYDGAVIGDIPNGFPTLSFSFPWSHVPELLIPGVIIAFVGFAEASSVARTFATRDRTRWNPDREFVSLGAANLASAVFGGYPVGGSFSRSSVNRLTGARTRWSAAISGLAVLLFLPFTSVLESMPRSVLAAVIITAVMGLVRPWRLVRLWRSSAAQAMVGFATLAATLVLSPRVDEAVLVGIALALGVHLWRERSVRVGFEMRRGGIGVVVPEGVLWFASAPELAETVGDMLATDQHTSHIMIDLGGLGRIDFTSAVLLRDLVEDSREAGVHIEVTNVPEHAVRIFDAVWPNHDLGNGG